MSVLHSVFFYFHENVSAATIQAQKRSIDTNLASIPGVSMIGSGAPLGVDRPVVDNSYGMSLHLLVKDRAALTAYQEHDLHQSFLKTFSSNWSSVKVCDTTLD